MLVHNTKGTILNYLLLFSLNFKTLSFTVLVRYRSSFISLLSKRFSNLQPNLSCFGLLKKQKKKLYYRTKNLLWYTIYFVFFFLFKGIFWFHSSLLSKSLLIYVLKANKIFQFALYFIKFWQPLKIWVVFLWIFSI